MFTEFVICGMTAYGGVHCHKDVVYIALNEGIARNRIALAVLISTGLQQIKPLNPY
jgi:hypothetical protein